jgi:hypothetical protein
MGAQSLSTDLALELIEVSLADDGTLEIHQNGGRPRPAATSASGAASGEQTNCTCQFHERQPVW